MSTRLLLAFLLPGSAAVWAQNHSITSATLDGGGGTSGGGSYVITGTIAQPDAHPPSTGGTYRLSGGFFSQYIALQQIGAPRLLIRKAGAAFEVVWASNVPGWVLQSNPTGLDPAGWSDVPGSPAVNGAEQFHTFAATPGKRFFRLRKP